MLTAKDLERLQGVHPDLVRVVQRAAQRADFRVLEGLRSLERQRELKAKGASQTMNSRHLTGHAVDLVPLDDNGQPSWDWPLYYPLAKVVKEAAKAEGVAIEWGGDWKKFKDGPHWQLPWSRYPTDKVPPEVKAEPKMQKESIVNKETVTWGAGIAASLGSVFTGHGPVQYALAGAIFIAFSVGVWLWWRGSKSA